MEQPEVVIEQANESLPESPKLKNQALIAVSTDSPQYYKKSSCDRYKTLNPPRMRLLVSDPSVTHISNTRFRQSSNLPHISAKQSLLQEQYRPLWKHGTRLATRFNSFEVDQNLVSKHLPALQENRARIEQLLSADKELTTLYTHPKLMRSYFFKGERDSR